MNKVNSTIIAVLIAAAFPVASAYAATRDPGANQRQHNQQQRIQQGVRSGELTRNGSRNLQGQARDIRREERNYKADGNFTRAERADVQRDLNHLSRDIRREKHDGQQRFDRGRYDYSGFDQRRVNNGYAYGHDRQDNWRNGHRYGNQVRGWDPSVDRREDRQHDRIAQGIRSGELTRHEAQRLMAEQRMIRQEERLYKSDGVLTSWERRDLQRDLDRASQHIFNETHDGQERR